MATVPLTPVSINPVHIQNQKQIYVSPVILDLTASPVDFSGWYSMSISAFPLMPNPCTAAFGITGAAGGTDGVITYNLDAGAFDTCQPGQCQIMISGQQTSADLNQILAIGVVTVNAT